MSADQQVSRRRSPLDDRHWYGMLCLANVDAVAERIRQMLEGKFYTFVSANSYSETDWRFSAVDVRTSNRLVKPIRVTKDPDRVSINLLDQSYSWGLHTSAGSEQEARAGSIHDKVQLSFNNSAHRATEHLTIDHFAPAGYTLQWIVAVEDHSEAAS